MDGSLLFLFFENLDHSVQTSLNEVTKLSINYREVEANYREYLLIFIGNLLIILYHFGKFRYPT